MEKSESNWEINASTSLLDLKLKDVWEYRDLLLLLVKRDFVSFYKQTILGPVWFFLQPLLQTIMFTFVFGRLAGISTDGIPQPLFYLAGTIAWNYFSDCLIKTSTVFKDNAQIFGKVYFPRLIMPLSIVVSNLVRFSVQFFLFLVMFVYYWAKGAPIHPSVYILLFPVLIVLMAALGLGCGMVISAVTTKYRDLAFLITFGVPLLMYATTVIYPLSKAPARYRGIVAANPMTAIIETLRVGFLGHGTFSWGMLGYSSAFTLIVLVLGTIIFNKVEKNFVDTV